MQVYCKGLVCKFEEIFPLSWNKLGSCHAIKCPLADLTPILQADLDDDEVKVEDKDEDGDWEDMDPVTFVRLALINTAK